uniref:Uncharacterized protein n=1 Tax=Oncorhynchus tshawytscha TaxID=74940 RepID=A0A8C8DAH8_ONCTS
MPFSEHQTCLLIFFFKQWLFFWPLFRKAQLYGVYGLKWLDGQILQSPLGSFAAPSGLSLHCLAPAILRQLSPSEADLVRDPSMHCKVRFRFSGSQFPPVIVFKIFHLGGGRQYISGKRVFRPSNQRHLLPFIIYCMGRENTWRSLSLQGLSRNILQWDSLEVGGKGTVADRLRQELLLLAPQIPCPLIGGAIPPRMLSSTPLPSTRRSARARTTAARMRHLYILGGTPKVSLYETYTEQKYKCNIKQFQIFH